MLEFLTKTFYKSKIYTDDLKLFGKIYKWDCGLFILLQARWLIISLILVVYGIIWKLFYEPADYELLIFDIVLIILILVHVLEMKKMVKLNPVGIQTPMQIRSYKIEELIRRYVSRNGKALGKKEWKAIKKRSISLYNNLLCEKCNHCCYLYSLEIAKTITDSILIWGAVEDPFVEGKKKFAHAVILRNGYIYDSNMRQSEKKEDFFKLYNFKTYKEWTYEEYSRESFREEERAEFRKWCNGNNVLGYSKF